MIVPTDHQQLFSTALHAAAIALVTLALTACSTLEIPREQRAQQAETRLLPESSRTTARPPAALPEAVRTALGAPPLAAPLQLSADEPRFDVTAQRVPAAAFFQGLMEDTPYNVIVHPDVEGELSMTLRDVTVPEVMQVARDLYGYEFERSEIAYLILPTRLESRLLRLNYLNVRRHGNSGTRITAGDLKQEEDAENEERFAGSRIRTESESLLWADVEEIITRMLDGEPEGASAITSPEAGTVAVRATPATLRQIETFLEQLQGNLNRQVVFEARILEVRLNDGYSSGVDWQSIGSSSGSSTNVGLSTGNDIGIDPATTFGLTLLRDGSFDGVINALQRQGDVQVLSAPRVSTLNHQKAVIKIGTDEFFQTDLDIDQRVIDGQLLTEIQPTFEPFFSGIALDVTPSIEDNGWITLHVQPSVTTVREVARTIDSGGQQSRFNLAQSDVRQSDSIVRAQDNEMIIIGGLIEERDEQTTGRVPILGRIPLLGWLFSYDRRSSNKYELVILLRPRLVNSDTWQSDIDAHRRRIQHLYEPN